MIWKYIHLTTSRGFGVNGGPWPGRTITDTGFGNFEKLPCQWRMKIWKLLFPRPTTYKPCSWLPSRQLSSHVLGCQADNIQPILFVPKPTIYMVLWRQSYPGLFLEARFHFMVMFREGPKPFPRILGLQSERRIKKRLSDAANAIIDQRWNNSCTAPRLTPHSHACKRRSICNCVYISPLFVVFFHFIKRERKKIFIYVLLSSKYHHSWLQKALDVLCEIGSLGPAWWLAPKLIYMICLRKGQTGRVLALGNLTWPTYRKRASPQVASFWPCDGRARKAAAGWRTGCLCLWACLVSSAGQALRLLYMRRRDKRMLADQIEPLWLFEWLESNIPPCS